MRVTIFSPYSTQPYIWLYKGALEQQGIVVNMEPDLNPRWLLSKGKSCDAIHLHWIDQVYRVSTSNVRFGPVKRLLNSLVIKSLRGGLRVVGFAIALLLTKLQGKIIVYTVHEFARHYAESKPLVLLRRIVHWLVLSLADQIHAHNHYSRRVLETVYGRKEGIQVISIGNYAGHYANEISKSEARQRLGLPPQAFVYLFLGWVRPYKGVQELIAAFEKLDAPHSRLLIVGQVSKSIYKTITDLAQKNPAIKLVPEFVPDEDIQLYMNACDVCVLPYRYITTSSAIMLAWTFGRPAIAPAIATFPELVTPETGLLYDPDQPNALTIALQQAQAHAWSESEVLDYVRQFDWDNLGPQLASLYQTKTDAGRRVQATPT
jgi:glycosyltransferase involved in cell wall biosynthesis